MPGRWGLWGFNGLVVVELAGSRVTVRCRPWFLGRLLGVVPLTAEPGSGLTAATARVRLGWGWSIAFKLPGGQEYLFITTEYRKDQILSWLTATGFRDIRLDRRDSRPAW